MENKKIIMTGGGSAGHVTPNLALVPRLKELGYEIEYIGTKDGIERKIIEENHIKYHVISSGKLRRYFDVKNFTDPFKVIKGIWEAYEIIKKEKPNIVFSKGGFVAVPVVLGAYFNKIPVIAHESDITPGLANKLSSPYATKICVTFPEAAKKLNKNKAVLTGNPIRKELFEGSKIKGIKLCGFTESKPVIFVMGGSLGARAINDVLRRNLNVLLKTYNIIHICGKGNIEEKYIHNKDYKQFEYINEELPHMIAAADIVLSRAGANSIFEFLALKKPNLLIPLSAKSSRGDQILNAKSFEKSGYSLVLEEEKLEDRTLIEKINELYNNKENYIRNMENSKTGNGVEAIVGLIEKFSIK
ncbi:undecaprenyldiphospho-muramoylpentapeptide beta-N-acetylglucosaminyltransferase [Clostridium rhizosphaerae]|nr:undecaprenyldiphospho-muramoylpentapeptide beta-N-acetylglucosaminyltransferase [Clostridium rhizosphaerae]